jgi:para-nitrobenzyl esterase
MLVRVRSIGLALLLSACAAEPGSAPLPASESLELRVQQGALVGHAIAGGVREYLGIPFAEPPIGPLRWAAPVPKEPWREPRVADDFGPRCPQASSHGVLAERESEDCLYLNVWAPARAQGAAVMLWIHGGGNRDGTASDFFTSGALLAERYGVIVVTVNYRLGVLGFLTHDQEANQGLWDQQLSMRWTQENIAAFGGDPANITIFGESAGSSDVCLQLAAPSSQGLFARAISESGGCTTRRKSRTAGERDTTQLVEQLGCSGQDTLSCLRAIAVPDLFLAVDTLAARAGFGPVVDGDFTPEEPRALYDQGKIARVPYMLGSNHDEGSAFTLDAASLADEAQYKQALARLGADPEELMRYYAPSAFPRAQNPFQAAYARAWGDARMVCSTLDVAIRAEQAGLPVYVYNFDMSMDGPDGVFGAAHAFEIGFVFGTIPMITPEQKAVSDRMQHHWTQFAKTGDPNTPALHPWPSFEHASDLRVSFANETITVKGFRAQECDFWRNQYAKAFEAR